MGSPFRPFPRKERQKERKKTGPPPVWGNGPVLVLGSKKAQAFLPALLDYAKLS
jgi:hypothetical protein